MRSARFTGTDPLTVSLATGVGGGIVWLVVVGLVSPVDYAFLAAVATLLVVQGAIVAVTFRRADTIHPTLTIPTVITVVRGSAIAVLGGFLFVSPEGRVVWVPTILYATAAGLDVVDGVFARLRGTVTAVGARLDTEMDALGLLVGAAVAISLGMAPLVYLAVGLARYAFVAGLRVRRWRGHPVHALPASDLRRYNAAAQMAVVIVLLAPWPGPTVSKSIALVAMVPFLLVFARDWLLATGRRRGPVW